MIVFKHDLGLSPGTWRWSDPRLPKRILLSCPACGHVVRLRVDAIETKTGMGRASVPCPKAACDFHQMIRLGGWKPRPAVVA